MQSLYDKNGYVSIPVLLGYGQTFTYCWAGRGTGKTYGALKYCIENNLTFMLVRSRDAQIKALQIPEMSPFHPLNLDNNWSIQPFPLKEGILGFYNSVVDEKTGKLKPTGKLLGFAVALSTIGKLRGFSGEGTDIIIYDEFIPVKGEMPLKDAGFLFASLYETVARNREIKDGTKVKALLLSNSENLACDIFMYYKLMGKASDMAINNQSVAILKNRETAMFNLWDSPISEKKKNTALYKMLGEDSSYSKMSLGNEFYSADYSGISSQNLNEYRPVLALETICVYEHKMHSNIYISTHKSGNPETYEMTKRGLQVLKYNNPWLLDYYMSGNILYENVTVKSIFEKMIFNA